MMACRLTTNAPARPLALAMLVMLMPCAGVGAQAPDSSWLERLQTTIVAGIFARPVTYTISDQESKAAWLYAELGLRLSPFASLCGAKRNTLCRVTAPITLTPHLALGATELLGIEPVAGASSYATAEMMGLRLAYPIRRRVVPFVSWRSGTHSSEQFENGDVVNIWGDGRSLSAGIELPITRLGRGLSIGVTQHRGAFTSIETRDLENGVKILSSTNRPVTAFSWQVGWSGPFTGVTWPWQ
jgi:hypothetical protein